MLPTVTIKFTEPPLSQEQFRQAVQDRGISIWRQVSASPDKLEYVIQPLTLNDIMADLVKTGNLVIIPEVQSLESEYQNLGTEELLVRYEESIQEFFALHHLVTRRAWDSFEVSKIARLIREKYWGYPKQSQSQSQTNRQPKLTIRSDDLE